ncbi:CFS1-like protein [Gymnopilus junonius]|uniref:CFS1-like protein n=1 Tax=Gymnopilus junonius TaxID=109634 RepID=A0A9P5NSV2_GYMJU|nr:CFS1-like protein [Gymnopilus junonius]
MQKITIGQLRVLTYSHIYTFPIPEPGNDTNPSRSNPRPDLKAELRVVNDSFWVRLCAMGDLGFAEAYMYGDVECDDLVALFQMFLENRENLSNMDSPISFLFTLPQKLTSYRFLNTIGNSRSNISAHYDISNDMFAGFLSEDMTYSCAIFPDLDGDVVEGKDNQNQWSGGQGLKRLSRTLSLPPSPPSSEPSETPSELLAIPSQANEYSHPSRGVGYPSPSEDPLYAAQILKLQHLIDKLHIPPPSASGALIHVLEIGTGWGALAIRIAQQYPHVLIDTITLSSAQKDLAEQRISAEGLGDRITVHLMDYRNMPPEWKGRFSRFVSVEMIEAVGREFLERYWQVVDWAMEKKDAVGVVQVISIPEARFERYIQEIDFIRKWLIVESIDNIGPHYARTLREWRRRFVDRFEAVIVPALQKEYQTRREAAGLKGVETLGRDEIEVFKRKWICKS